ncbi:peptidylprolyl isomerase [Candidatus Pelagibacter communis]|uniref:peptidylprolyl isomerase n=1 Tax=Pelagibacter ubique TaxID=198252 RepID=UPI00094C29DF|nr:peptidylprolyl isomerase [Candidatus Pelagibacter ubique]
MTKKIIFFFIIFFIQMYPGNSSEVKIVSKVNNKILTNIDIENESKYLLILNSNLKNLNKNELYELSKNSLIRQIIKKEEVVKRFNLEKNSELSEKLLKKNYTALGFKNEEKYSNFLIKEGLNIEFLKEKLLIERLWNSLIYEKFKNKIKIDQSIIKNEVQNLINNQEKIYEYNLSEILFDYKTNNKELFDFIDNYGFEAAASKYSISDTSSNGGKIGWIKNSNLNEKLKKQISNLSEGQISKPIKIPNGNLLIKLNQKKEIKSKIDLELETQKQINFEQNRQLNSFSLNFYKKLKQNSTINEY